MKNKNNAFYNYLKNNYLNRWYMLKFYKSCLRKTIKGDPDLELARRFFNYKIHQLSKNMK